MSSVNPTRQQPRMSMLWLPIHSFSSGVMIVRSLMPFRSMKYTMAVQAMPPKRPTFHFRRLLNSKVKIRRERNCTTVPNTKAMPTERKIPRITESAFSVLSKSPTPRVFSGAAILKSATTNVAPRSSNTSETVVEVGIPSELNTSSRITSVTITAIKMAITS